MSGTQTEAAAEKPKLIIAKGTKSLNGDLYETADVKVGSKTITFRKLDVVDTWNLCDVAPANASAQWRNMALLTMSVTDIDSKIILSGFPGKVRLNDISRTMREIGADGLAAIGAAMAELDPTPDDPAAAEDDHKATVGNLSETAASAS